MNEEDWDCMERIEEAERELLLALEKGLALNIDKEMMGLLKEDIPPAFLKAFEEEG